MKIYPFILCLGSVFLSSGCASLIQMGYENAEKPHPNALGYRTRQQLDKLKLGMSSWEVATMLGGRSIDISMKIAAEGKTEVWRYPMGQLISFIEGSGASFSYGFTLGPKHDPEPVIRLTFLGDKLTVIEGV